jgi:hypothetical protein
MTAPHIVDPAGLLGEAPAEASPRSDAAPAAVDHQRAAVRGRRRRRRRRVRPAQPDRVAQRNGYRHRPLAPRWAPWTWRAPSCPGAPTSPSGCSPRRKRAESALITVVADCYLAGVSTRRMDKLVKDPGHRRTRVVQRLDRQLQDAGMKLSSVASPSWPSPGADMLVALVSGTRDADVLAELAPGRLRPKISALREALTGRFGGPTHADRRAPARRSCSRRSASRASSTACGWAGSPRRTWVSCPAVTARTTHRHQDHRPRLRADLVVVEDIGPLPGRCTDAAECLYRPRGRRLREALRGDVLQPAPQRVRRAHAHDPGHRHRRPAPAPVPRLSDQRRLRPPHPGVRAARWRRARGGTPRRSRPTSRW